MKYKALVIAMAFASSPLFAGEDAELQREIQQLRQQTAALQTQLNRLQKKLVANQVKKEKKIGKPYSSKSIKKRHSDNTHAHVVSETSSTMVSRPSQPKLVPAFHTSTVTVHSLDADPESLEFYPTALVADEHVVTYIAGTPIVTSPYLGSRPAFDGSDYIVNISSINRDIRLMQQRRSLYRAYESIGYPVPNMPILAFSGKVEPVGSINQPRTGTMSGDLTLGSSELDLAAILNNTVEGYMSIGYDESPPAVGGQRVSNSNLFLNMGFVNIGNLDRSPLYFTGGQLFVPFGRFSSSMVSAPLTMVLGRTKARPFILGYKSQQDTGPYAAVYGFKSDTTLGTSGIGGVNAGYVFSAHDVVGEIGGSVISAINDAGGMQYTNSAPGTTFGGFASITNGNESVRKIPAVGVHAYTNIDRYSLTAEWLGAAETFRTQDLSFNNHGARPQAGQIEGAVTFMSFNKPSSFALGYQWTRQALALNLPKNRISGAYSISIWKDTVESLELRRDKDYGVYSIANGAAPSGVVNANTIGTGRVATTLLAQLGIYF